MIDEIESHREELAELCRRFHVRRLDLFGSAARGDFDPEHSDIDFIVEFDRSAPQYFGLKEELEALFGRKVDPQKARNIADAAIDYDTVWRLIRDKLPELQTNLTRLLRAADSSPDPSIMTNDIVAVAHLGNYQLLLRSPGYSSRCSISSTLCSCA